MDVGPKRGFVSVLQRLRQLGDSGDALTDYHEIQSVRYTTIFASGVTGVLFAAVLYLLFAGGLIQGTMFPDLTPPGAQAQESRLSAGEPQPQAAVPAPTTAPDAQRPATAVVPEAARGVQGVVPAAGAAQKPQSTVYNFVAERHPHTARDVALLVIWAFLAGFFERLVPDNLNRLLATCIIRWRNGVTLRAVAMENPHGSVLLLMASNDNGKLLPKTDR